MDALRMMCQEACRRTLARLRAHSARTDADGMLIIGDCRVDDLANEFGTPVLVVAEEALRARARECVAELTSRWPNARCVQNATSCRAAVDVGRSCRA